MTQDLRTKLTTHFGTVEQYGIEVNKRISSYKKMLLEMDPILRALENFGFSKAPDILPNKEGTTESKQEFEGRDILFDTLSYPLPPLDNKYSLKLSGNICIDDQKSAMRIDINAEPDIIGMTPFTLEITYTAPEKLRQDKRQESHKFGYTLTKNSTEGEGVDILSGGAYMNANALLTEIGKAMSSHWNRFTDVCNGWQEARKSLSRVVSMQTSSHSRSGVESGNGTDIPSPTSGN